MKAIFSCPVYFFVIQNKNMMLREIVRQRNRKRDREGERGDREGERDLILFNFVGPLALYKNS